MKEIENETQREILLALREEGELDRKELEERTGKSKKWVHDKLNELNDLGAVLSHRVGNNLPSWKYKYKLNEERVNFSRKTDEFVPDLISFLPGVLVSLVLYFLVENLSSEIFFGVSLAIFFPFAWKLYQIFSVEDHFTISVEETS